MKNMKEPKDIHCECEHFVIIKQYNDVDEYMCRIKVDKLTGGYKSVKPGNKACKNDFKRTL